MIAEHEKAEEIRRLTAEFMDDHRVPDRLAAWRHARPLPQRRFHRLFVGPAAAMWATGGAASVAALSVALVAAVHSPSNPATAGQGTSTPFVSVISNGPAGHGTAAAQGSSQGSQSPATNPRVSPTTSPAIVAPTAGAPASPSSPPAPSAAPTVSSPSYAWYAPYVASNCFPSTVWANVSIKNSSVTCVADPMGSGQIVAEYAINDPSDAQFGTPRGDTYSTFLMKPGSNEYISIPVYAPPTGLPASIKDNASSFLTFASLSNYGGGASSQLSCGLTTYNAHDGKVHYECRINNSTQVWLGPDIDDTWHDITVHVTAESCAGCTDGSLQLWFDGQPQTFVNGQSSYSNVHVIAQNNSGVYQEQLDINQVRASGMISGTYTLYHGAAAIGPTYASVSGTACCGGKGP